MTTVERRRVWILTMVFAGELTVAEAVELLGLSEGWVEAAVRRRRSPAGRGPRN
jgi:hypothetical protein